MSKEKEYKFIYQYRDEGIKENSPIYRSKLILEKNNGKLITSENKTIYDLIRSSYLENQNVIILGYRKIEKIITENKIIKKNLKKK